MGANINLLRKQGHLLIACPKSDFNLYAYVANSPVNRADGLGTCPDDPTIGSLDQWPPEWPRPDENSGWPKPSGPSRVRLPPGIRTTPTEGRPGTRVPVDYLNQPKINPSNPTLPANPTFWDRLRLLFGGAAQIFQNWPRMDTLPPMVLPNTQIKRLVCSMDPSNPGCLGPPI
jgi:hypothetical protein